MIVNDSIYIINTGDSRCISSLSSVEGHSLISQAKQMTKDHKPSDPTEFYRIVKSGGYIYQT
jgi:serine/threonine protein phosphatase PrpC